MTDADAAGRDPAADPEEEPRSYAAAERELEQILSSLEADDVDVDELSAQVARARFLITWCRGRLASAEVTISELLADPEADGQDGRSTA